MADENKHVVIANFASEDKAKQAAQHLMEWDDSTDDIKLGGIGILTGDNGKIKTRKVGRRAASSGAKWGLALGAVTGILSGGVTLIGGAVVGTAGGAVMGSLFHKSLGLTDADNQRLEQHLKSGGASLVVMADDFEVQPTKAQLASLGGKVEDYAVPDEVMEQVEEATAVAPVVAAEAASHVDERAPVDEDEVPAITGLNGGVRSVEGIGSTHRAALVGIGITSKRDLLERGATPEGRAEIAAQSKISEKNVSKWVSSVDLTRVPGVGARYSRLLQAAGVTTVGLLAQQDPEALYAKLVATNTEHTVVQVLPSAALVESWVAKAKDLPQVVTN